MTDKSINEEVIRLRSQVAALEQLLEVYEQTVLEQSDRLEQARQTEQALAEAEDQARRLTLLNEMSAALTQATSRDEVFNIIAVRISRIVKDDRASLALITPEGDRFEVLALDGDKGAIPTGTWLSLEDTNVGQAIRQNRIINTPDSRSSPYLNARQLAERGLQSTINVPLMIGGQAIGTLNVASTQLNAFDSSDERLLLQIASLLASTLENRRLFEQTQAALAEQRQARSLLDKRVQELNCINEIGREIAETPPLPELLAWVTERIPPAMQYPGLCQVAIEYDGQVYGVAEAIQLPCQVANALWVSGEALGRIYIAYTEKCDFLDEESALIGGIASRVGAYIENLRLVEQLRGWTAELETVAEVSTAVSTILDTTQLLQKVVDLTKSSFNLYHAHIYLLDETPSDPPLDRKGVLVLAAGAGEVGRQMAAQGWSIPLRQEHSLTARAARTRQGVIANDVRLEPDFLPNPLLPKTRSEIAVPIILGDQLLGILDLQADIANHFTEADIRTKTTLASQIAVALQNTRQYEQTQVALAEVQATYRQFVQREWTQFLGEQQGGHWHIEHQQASLPPEQGSNGDSKAGLETPILLRGQQIGSLRLQDIDPDRQRWTAEEIALVETVSEQLAQTVENLRLFDDTQRRASREQLTREITDKMRASPDIDTIIQTGLSELARVLKVSRTYVKLTSSSEQIDADPADIETIRKQLKSYERKE